jgi:lipopolysaccharide export LptBFGC system permease protein LptF
MWRLLLLTAGVLVTVISFAVTVRLTAEGRLGPLDTLRYMFLAMPPMLQYALPFAAGFGATLAYHRMSQDNELTAAAAGGISHRALLAPALATGIVLAGVIGELNGWVIPSFLRSMEELVVQDATRMVYNTLSAGRPLELNDNMQVIADSVRRLGGDESNGVSERLLLTGVFAVQTDPKGEIEMEASASRAMVRFAPLTEGEEGPAARGMTRVVMDLENPGIYRRSSVTGSGETSTLYWLIPGVFNDDPKYLTNAELRELPDHPDRMNVIDMRRRDLAVHLAERDACSALNGELRAKGTAQLKDEAGRTLTIRAHGIEYRPSQGRWEILAGPGKPIEIEIAAAGQASGEGRKFSPRTAGLRTDIGKDRWSRQLKLRLDMEDVRTRAKDDDPAGERVSMAYNNLSPESSPLASLLKMTSAELLHQTAKVLERDPGARAASPADDLDQRIKKLKREIVSKQHERAADSVACLVMVLTGAATAMRLGTSMPLTVYLWSFFPALFSVISIAAGQQLTRNLGPGGLVVLWGGVGLLAAYAAVAFWMVRKH